MALFANCHRDSKTRAFSPHDFHPFQERSGPSGIPLTADNLPILAGAFVSREPLAFERNS